MNNWTLAKLAELTRKVGSGATPLGGSDVYVQRGTPLIRSMNVRFEGFDSDGIVYLTDKQAAGLNGAEVEGGDVLLNITGASIGRVTTAPQEMSGARVNQHVCIIRTENQVLNPQFLSYFLATPATQSIIFEQESGVTRQALTKQKILDFDIPLPPRNEQGRIVSTIKLLRTRSRSARKALDAVGPLLEQFRQSVLAAAFRGDLTADWRAAHPNTEPASALLARIRTERRRKWEQAELTRIRIKGKSPSDDKWKQRYAEPLPADDQDDLPQLPEGWTWASLDEICSLIGDIDHKMPKAVERGVKFLSAKDLLDDGTLNFTKNIKLISEHDYVQLSRKSAPRRGDIIYSRIGACLGKARLVETDEKFLVSYSCCTVRPIVIHPQYLARFLDSGFVLERALDKTQSIGVPDLGLDKIKRFAIPVCCGAEQDELVERLDLAFAKSNTVTSLISEGTKEVERLDQSILAKAFRGELVPQDPTDEPASELLARIRTFRSSANSEQDSRQQRTISRKEVNRGKRISAD